MERVLKLLKQRKAITSKASFLDNNYIPTYGIDDNKAIFSGERINRGMYKSKDDMLMNTDVNGAYNILRKVFPTAFSNKSLKDNGIVNAPTCPVSLTVA